MTDLLYVSAGLATSYALIIVVAWKWLSYIESEEDL